MLTDPPRRLDRTGAGTRASTAALVPESAFAIIDPLRDARWLELTERTPTPCAFHHPAWLRLLAWQYHYPVIGCCVLDAAGELEAGMPLALVGGRFNRARFVGLPFSDMCPPLARDGRESQLRRLGLGLDQLRRRDGIEIQLRGALPHAPAATPRSEFHRHVLPLTDGYDEVLRGMKPQVARGGRRAVREGLKVELRRDRGALADFYRLHVRTRSRQGAPTQPRRFILGFEDLFRRDLGFVLLVTDAGTPVAAAVFLQHRGILMYKYGASAREALPKRPNNLLFLEAVRWACELGLRELDFGRTNIGHESLRAFKRSFGTEEELLVYTALSEGPATPASAALGPALERVIRRCPPFVSRVAGQILYRDFAP